MRRTIFTEEHHLFRDAFKHFLEKEVVPHYEQWEKDGIVSREMWLKAGQQGFLGLAVPEAYGGSGVDDFRYSAIMAEESARAGVVSAGMVIGLHNDIILPYFITYANEEQKQRWLPGMCSGELITAIAMTEPDTGSDLAAIRTTAERRGDYYILNRRKIELSPDLQKLAQEDFCYLTTSGRNSGRPHTIEIWFALHEQTLYLLSGGRDKSDWVKNALHIPAVQMKINSTIFSGTARLVTNTEEDTLARKIVFEKYVLRSSDDLVDWSRTSLPIAVDIMM